MLSCLLYIQITGTFFPKTITRQLFLDAHPVTMVIGEDNAECRNQIRCARVLEYPKHNLRTCIMTFSHTASNFASGSVSGSALPAAAIRAIGLASFAVLNQNLEGPAVAKITIVPSEGAAGMVQFGPMTDSPLPQTTAGMRNQIVVHLAGIQAERLIDEGRCSTAYSLSLQHASNIAERIADLEMPGWRMSRSSYAQQIVQSCMMKASLMVEQHEASIRRLADVLVVEGELTGDRVRELLAA